MKLPFGRRQFSRPSIPVDINRLREIISHGDIAQEALNAPHLRRGAEMSFGRMDDGVLGDLIAKRAVLASARSRASSAEEREAARQAIDANEVAIAREQKHRKEANAVHLATLGLRDRCVSYAIEAGVNIRDLARFDTSQTIVRGD